MARTKDEEAADAKRDAESADPKPRDPAGREVDTRVTDESAAQEVSPVTGDATAKAADEVDADSAPRRTHGDRIADLEERLRVLEARLRHWI